MPTSPNFSSAATFFPALIVMGVVWILITVGGISFPLQRATLGVDIYIRAPFLHHGASGESRPMHQYAKQRNFKPPWSTTTTILLSHRSPPPIETLLLSINRQWPADIDHRGWQFFLASSDYSKDGKGKGKGKGKENGTNQTLFCFQCGRPSFKRFRVVMSTGQFCGLQHVQPSAMTPRLCTCNFKS
ncbi:hypothetical protein LZ32DRAFT_113259 [Colletotrichum eremochloae]|nr:hypothetical protein LZ32DRAFT_113259 [Colletotrichum eremochloae]